MIVKTLKMSRARKTAIANW
ncbi:MULTISPECIES: hypothetical protein [Cellvibrio]